MLNASVTVEEELKTNSWAIPRAGSGGQVTFMGLQSVHVCARTGERSAAPAARRESWKRILNE